MNEDRDYRPEALGIGDEVRWMGRWCRIMGIEFTSPRENVDGSTVSSSVQMRLLHGDDWFTVFYRPGSWVAARPQGVAA